MISKTGRCSVFYKMNRRHRHYLTFGFEHNVARSGVNRNWRNAEERAGGNLPLLVTLLQ